MSIESIKGYECLDSRGNPTVSVQIKANAQVFFALVPSGASTGVHEAHELRDKEKRYNGKGVSQAVNNINTIIGPQLNGKDPISQEEIDNAMNELDGTEHKEKLGANAILGVSLAVAQAGAHAQGVPLYKHLSSLAKTQLSMPVPQLNVINSGKHAGVDNDIQEHMLLPTEFSSFSERIRAGVECYHTLKKMLKKKFGAQATLLGDEGGFAPPISSIHERLDLLMSAVQEAGYEHKMKLGLDCASSEFYKDGKYTIGSTVYDQGALIDFYNDLCKTYPVITIEDGMAEDDWEGWTQLTKEMGDKIQLVGDDLLVTNTKRIEQAKEHHACNALLLKVNQIGTVTESINAANMTSKNGWNVVVSHRSGETEDSFIADLCVGLGAAQSKFGAPARSDRTAKYNRLLHIEEELN